MQQQIVKTSHADIAIYSSTPSQSTSSPTILLIHGNSSSHQVFRAVYTSSIAQSYPFLVLDLPGHGASSDAHDTKRSYTQPGYARCVVEVLDQLQIEKVVLFGHSLGGHIAIEMLDLLPREQVKGIVLVGTPPCIGAQVSQGFLPSPHVGLAFSDQKITGEDAVRFASAAMGTPFEPWMAEMVSRSDPRARKIMGDSFAKGEGVDQVKLVEETHVPTAIINGGSEPFVNLDYLDKIQWGNLWGGKCVRVQGRGHSPFWEEPEAFTPLLERFLKDVGGV